jgi:hypothetical protein
VTIVAARRPEVEVRLLRTAISGSDGSNIGGLTTRPAAYHQGMATESGGRQRTPIIRVGPVPGRNWTVSVDDDPTPISEHETRAEAETAARTYAETFGYPEIVVYGLGGDEERIRIDDPDPQPRYPGGVTGESAA